MLGVIEQSRVVQGTLHQWCPPPVACTPVSLPVEAGTHRSAQLERRLEAAEAELVQNREHADLLNHLLQEAKVSLQLLGEEADVECLNLQGELQTTQDELDEAMAECRGASSPQSGAYDELAAQTSALREEIQALRDSEIASWEHSTWTHQEFEAGLFALKGRLEAYAEFAMVPASPDSQGASSASRQNDDSVVSDLRRRCTAFEEAWQRESGVARASEEEAAMIRELCAEEVDKLVLAEESVEEAREDLGRQLKVAESRVEGVEDTCSTLLAELDTSGEEVAQLQARHENAERAAEELRASCAVLQQESDTRKKEATAEAKRRLQNAQNGLDPALQAELDKQLQAMRDSCDEDLQAESNACHEAREEAFGESAEIVQRARAESTAQRAENRWFGIMVIMGEAEAKRGLRLCRSAWTTGVRRKSERMVGLTEQLRTLAASPLTIKELERQCDQGERRLAALEQVHVSYCERIEEGARTITAEFEEAQSCWQAEVRELTNELRQAKVSARRASEDVASERARADAAIEELDKTLLAQMNAGVKNTPSASGLSVAARAKLEAEVLELRQQLAGAEEAIGMLVAGGNVGADGGSGGPSGAGVSPLLDA